MIFCGKLSSGERCNFQLDLNGSKSKPLASISLLILDGLKSKPFTCFHCSSSETSDLISKIFCLYHHLTCHSVSWPTLVTINLRSRKCTIFTKINEWSVCKIKWKNDWFSLTFVWCSLLVFHSLKFYVLFLPFFEKVRLSIVVF